MLFRSRLEAGGMPIVPAPFSLRGLLRELTGVFMPQVSQKGMRFVIVDETGDLERIVGDVERIRQILINLLSNAVKFTDQGEILLHIEQTESDRKERQILFCVQDTGIGIAESERVHLFERFRQLDGTRTRRYGGTGLGLAISKLLAERMDGRIWLDESYAGGSRFCLLLPVSAQP